MQADVDAIRPGCRLAGFFLAVPMIPAALREQFPVAREYCYFNHASIAPLPQRSAEAMRAQVADAMRHGVHGYQRWMEDCAGLRRAAAEMLGCGADEIAITKNTSEGLSAIANGIDWRPGDMVVGVAEDFPANYLPWKDLQTRRGVRFRNLQLRAGKLDPDELDRACAGARLAALSYVHFVTGFRLDLEAAGEICRRRGCLLAVDAVQGLGAFPVDVKACGIHALSASGHKWLLGPEGCGVLFIDRDWMPAVRPVEIGWTNVEGYEDFREGGGLRADAGRFECGTLNSVGCAGLRASIELLNAIAPQAGGLIDALADRLLKGARAKGYEPAAERGPQDGSGIVSLRKPGVDSAAAVAALLEKRVSTAARLGWIRVAPHAYNTPEEIDRLLELLP